MSDAQPMKIDNLLPEELEALESEGRMLPDGSIKAPTVAQSAPTDLSSLAPPPSPEIMARIQNAKALESGFVHETPDGKRTEGGNAAAAEKAAEKAAQAKAATANPDWFGKPVEDPIEAADKERFLAMLMGAPKFTKTYELFAGRVVVTFQTRLAIEEEECAKQVQRDERHDGLAYPLGSPQYSNDRYRRFANYQFAAALYRLGDAKGVPRAFAPFDHPRANPAAEMGAIRLAFEDLERELPHPLMVALRSAHKRFETMVATLTLAAEHPDFWQAVAGT